MPKIALAELFANWDGLLRHAAKHRDQKRLSIHLDKLQAAFDRLHDLEALRESLQAQQQQATQEMGVVKDDGKTAAIQVRQILKGILGPRNEALVEFDVAPIRKRGPRRKVAAEKKPAP